MDSQIIKSHENLTVEDIKKYICPAATEKELFMFLNICKTMKLNPFLREAYLVKYGNAPASILTGYEVYLKRAHRLGDYAGFDTVFSGSVTNGDLVCTIKIYKKGMTERAFITHEVEYVEYVQNKGDGTPNRFWKEKPKTMLRKVAISQGMRLAWPDDLAGMPYISEEFYPGKVPQSTKPEVEMPQGKDEIEKAEIVDPPPETQTKEPIPIITSEEADSLMQLAQKNGYEPDRVVEYMKSLHYETQRKTVLQILQQLNRWDHETCVLHFEQEASPIEDVPKDMLINKESDDA